MKMDMEVEKVYALEKTGMDGYYLRTLYLPRETVQEIRQQEPTACKDLHGLFDGVPYTDVDGVMNFVMPDSHGGLCIHTRDMGRDFPGRNQYNGDSVEGAREEVMAELRQRLQRDGYHFRPNACFRNVDVLETLQKITEHNTSFFQTDFAYDREMLLEAARDRNAPRQFFWMSRKGGTWCFPERSVHIRQTSPHNTWFYYGGCRGEHVKAFRVELRGMREDRVMGDILEIDYQKHLDYLCTHSHDPAKVEVVFKNPNSCRTFGWQEYEQNWQAIADRYGTVERKRYLVPDECRLSRDMAGACGMFWDAVDVMEVDDYVKRLEYDRLHEYGYTAGDLALTGPVDAERAVKQGLECYILNRDGSREPVHDCEDYRQALSNGKLFGMEAGEKDILRYFKQDAVPLFNEEEMQKIYSLALQAGMENEPEGSGLLDGIIHKAECFLPGERQGEAPAEEQEVLPGDVIQ